MIDAYDLMDYVRETTGHEECTCNECSMAMIKYAYANKHELTYDAIELVDEAKTSFIPSQQEILEMQTERVIREARKARKRY